MDKPLCLCPKLPIPPGTDYRPKVIYLTRRDAKRAGKGSTNRPKPYLCPHCNLWHLTSAPRRQP